MEDDKVRRDENGETPPQDSLVKALRDIPRMRAVGDEGGGKVYAPPPPMASRIGGLSQGCGSVLLTVLSVLMLLVAMWFGYYLWGPGLLLGGGLLLVAGTLGVWRGHRTPVMVSTAVLVVMAVVAYFWNSFVPATGALSPLGGLGVFLSPLSLLIMLVLAASLIFNVISLLHWKRLAATPRRGIMVWVAAAVVLVVVAVVLHFTQQQQRETWLKDHFDTWKAEAAGDTLIMGANENVTLGYSFVTAEPTDDSRLDVQLAELDAAVQGGASVIRVSAGGDLLLEAETPRLFQDSNDEAGKQKAADRIARQEAAEKQYMDKLAASSVKLDISDSQYSPYLLVWASDNESKKVSWDDFTAFQERRIRYYGGLYKPLAYEIVSEPEAYTQYSSIQEPEGANMLDLWVAQTEKLITAVHDVSPDTKIGIGVSIQSDFDKQFYQRALTLDGIDFIAVRIFQPAAFQVTEDMLAQYGNPIDHGKEIWIVETWYGYCLAPQRSMDLDGVWLETVAAFAAKDKMSAMFANDFGCFLQPGGTLFQTSVNLDGRTDVWRRWQALVKTWKVAS
jgi:hypothetical protein